MTGKSGFEFYTALVLSMSTSSRSEYVEQIIYDISNYYGYNEFLAEKLFQLFPVDEVNMFFLLFQIF